MTLTQLQEWMGDVERINKETGELSASGELADSLELKGKTGATGGPHPLLALRQQLEELERHTHLDPACDQARSRAEALDCRGLAALTADTLVSNIHHRLAERPAEDARFEVEQFFHKPTSAPDSTETDRTGWLLLKALSLLTAQDSEVLSRVKPGLPAALVKCLYLLVALPAREESSAREETFQDLLVQVLLQLCKQPVRVEEMVETQELQCLVIALTLLWDQTSAFWRRQASRVLRAISAAKTHNTVPNLQAKNCVRICIQNLLRISGDLPGTVLAEVAVAVFSFIPDSYPLNPALFTEFDSNNGYTALEAILKRCEQGGSEEQFQPVKDLLALVASLTLLGKTELKVALCVSNPQPPGFKFDPVLTKGRSVKNLSAFQLLQNCFLRSEDSLLCCQVLQTMRMVWEWDQANFFLLEWSVQSLAQLAPCVWRKPAPVHGLFFSLLEMVVFQLNYIPHETLRAVQVVLKQAWVGTLTGEVAGAEFGLAAFSCFHRLTLRSGLLADVLSDGGLLELILSELRKRAKILRKTGIAPATDTGLQEQPGVENSERALTRCMLQVVSGLTLRSIRNTVFVRDLGMVPYIKIFLDEEQYRGPTLGILEQLSEVNPEEFMSTAVGALCSSTQLELGLKHDLLQSVLKVLENPNSCEAFRRAGGFTGLLSLVVDMEGALAHPPQGPVWGALGRQGVLDLLLLALHTLALAVHLHPVNSHSFQTEGYYERLADALLQLGCFQPEGQGLGEPWAEGPLSKEEKRFQGKSFHQFVALAEASSSSSLSAASEPPLPLALQTCVQLLSYLDQFATGTYCPPELALEGEVQGGGGEVQLGAEPLSSEEDPAGRNRSAAHSVSTVCSESHYRFTCDHTILHPGAIRVMMTLLPSVFAAEDPQLSLEVQFSVANHIQALVKSERNRQIMCEGGLVSTLLTHCGSILLGTNHPLHLPVTRILEKLSSQAITHLELRRYLRLSDPLMCTPGKRSSFKSSETLPPLTNGHSSVNGGPPKEAESKRPPMIQRSFSLLNTSVPNGSPMGSPLPLHQIISLVSMTAPRSFRPHRVSSSPAFVEFDMSESGYGCLFLPSLATVKGVNSDSIPTGGVGGDCRGFPPTAGLSFSCWFQISRFSSACDTHPLRLLSVVRHMSRAEQQYVCLSVTFSSSDGCLVISTEEEAFTFLDVMEPEVCTPSPLPAILRFKCSSHLVPGQWHHLAVVMAKEVKKSCRVSAYLNNKLVGAAKMRYVQPFPGQYVSMDPTAVIDVCALIGTPSLWKEHAALVWRVGPTYLWEEVLSPEAVGAMYIQGTAYLGNYLALRSADGEPLRLVAEERISFGINPAIAKITTVAEIREDYNEVDCRLIAKELGITSRDNSTPVFLAQNIGQHLSGTARTIGAALVGHFGVRTFTPRSAANGFLYIGGPAVLLSLVAMAPDDASLYAAVKVLLSVLETSPAVVQEMTRINGYKLLAFLLKMKSGLISSRTFQLVLSLSGSVDLGSGPARLQHNTKAIQALLCDLEVWQNASNHLDLSVLNHLADILKSSREGEGGNTQVLHSLGLLPKLLFLLADPTVSRSKVKVITCLIKHLLRGHFTAMDVRRVGLFLVYTLPPTSAAESSAVSDSSAQEDLPAETPGSAGLLWIRNQMLFSVWELLTQRRPLTADQQKMFFKTLGSDWFLLFLQPHLHPSTMSLGLLLLTHLLANHKRQNRFREGVSPGILVEGVEEPLVLMDNLQAHTWSYECLSVAYPGFDVLERLLAERAHLPQVYGALAALMLGKKGPHAPEAQGSLDEVFQGLIDGRGEALSLQLCPEAAAILLELVKGIITQYNPSAKRLSGADASWELQFPGSVMQFLCLLHSLQARDPLWVSPEFLTTLASVVYPQDCLEVCHPARKQVCDFIRILLMDSLLNVPARENTHPFLLLLEYSPETSSLEQRQNFQTELLEFLMDIVHMTSSQEGSNTHLNAQDSKTQKPDGQMSTLMENSAFFSKTLLHKLYTGMFLVEPETLLNFLADQIAAAMERGQSQRETTVTAIYTCTNKSLLYFLSRPRNLPAEQEVVTRSLRVLVERWDIVMATYNANITFVTCFLHCLLLIRSGSYPEGFGCEMQAEQSSSSRRRLLSHLLPRKTSRAHSPSLSHGTGSTTAVERELMTLVEACWCKIMAERRHTLEDTYKIELSAKQTGHAGPVSMSDISPLWEETAHKAWQSFTETERRKLASSHQKKPGLISTAVRFAQRRLGRETASMEKFLSCMEAHRQRGREIFESMRTNHSQLCASEAERVSDQWLRVEEELLRERAVFGPRPGVVLTRGWVQDAAEGPNRTRPRIRRKAHRRSKRLPGTLGLGVRTRVLEESRGGPEPDPELRILCEAGTEATEEEEEEEEEEEGQECERLTFFPVLKEMASIVETTPEPSTSPQPCSHIPTCPDTHIILQELDPGEEVKSKMSVLVVSGLSVTEGVLLFGKETLYVCEGFVLSSSGDVCCRNHHPSSVRDSFISTMVNKGQLPANPTCRRWSYEDIKEARFIRFLLEDNGLEIFMKNGHSAFLVFLNNDHVLAYKRLYSVVPSLRGRGVAEVIASAKKTPLIEKTALVKWQRGEMSNFEYLMHLNTLAGRTYNDLMQYPVFPWVLADYYAETLDLSNPTIFRDLSKPMGAQTEKRREMFIKRYNEVENSEGDLSAQCHYCTHYSSAIIVASFLVRMEPFSHTFLALQGGFDVPERMFHSVKSEWESASRDNMGDVRELIPEFYYLPDFLINSNHIQMGCMQDGTSLGDVVLPPWAKGDPQEFIRVQREALESEYVSSHLHLWIDLIFGHRQQGPAAVESINIFHPYFYAQRLRGSKGALTDPLIKSTILGYVSNFGQVPKQLFTKPHPPRSGSKKDGPSPSHPNPFFFKLDKLKPSIQPFRELLRGPVGQIVCLDKEVLVLEKNRLALPTLWNCYFSWGFPDTSCAFGNYHTEKVFAVSESLCDWGETLCAAWPNQTTVVTAGSSSVVCVWEVAINKDKLTHMKLKQALYGHTDTVTCLAVSEVHSVIVSGSRDLTCILWDLEELSYVTQLAGHKASITALAINDLTGEIASCAGSLLYLWNMKGQLLTWLDTTCGPQGNILCVAFTQRHEWDARNVLVTGCADGIIRIWRTEYARIQLPGSPEELVSLGQCPTTQADREGNASTAEVNLTNANVDGSSLEKDWERHLVLCRELNRSQTVSRRRYKTNPAITALAMSRTHATLLVGDAWGRVFTWTCE
ncbi:WD repeat- and FYVE domain-containing protein 4 [Aplochiton taeniatus]